MFRQNRAFLTHNADTVRQNWLCESKALLKFIKYGFQTELIYLM